MINFGGCERISTFQTPKTEIYIPDQARQVSSSVLLFLLSFVFMRICRISHKPHCRIPDVPECFSSIISFIPIPSPSIPCTSHPEIYVLHPLQTSSFRFQRSQPPRKIPKPHGSPPSSTAQIGSLSTCFLSRSSLFSGRFHNWVGI